MNYSSISVISFQESQSSESNLEKLLKFAEKFPNSTHPDVIEIREPKTLIAAKPWIPKTPTVRFYQKHFQ
jgi:hypothetical protein